MPTLSSTPAGSASDEASSSPQTAQAIREARLRRFGQSSTASETSKLRDQENRRPTFNADHREVQLEKFRQQWLKELEYKSRYGNEESLDEAARQKRLERQRNFVPNSSLAWSEDQIKERERLAEARKGEHDQKLLDEARKNLIQLEDQVKIWLPEACKTRTPTKDIMQPEPASSASSLEEPLSDLKLRVTAASRVSTIAELRERILDHFSDVQLIKAKLISRSWNAPATRHLRDQHRSINARWTKLPYCSALRQELVTCPIDAEGNLLTPDGAERIPRITVPPHPTTSLVTWKCSLKTCSPEDTDAECGDCRTLQDFLHWRIRNARQDIPISGILTPNPLISHILGGNDWVVKEQSEKKSLHYLSLLPGDPPTLLPPKSRSPTASWRTLQFTYPPIVYISIFAFDAFHWKGAEPGDAKNRTYLCTVRDPEGVRCGVVFDAVERFAEEIRDRWIKSKDKEYGRESKLIEEGKVGELGKLLPPEPRVCFKVGAAGLE